jgi:hypothetical protein
LFGANYAKMIIIREREVDLNNSSSQSESSDNESSDKNSGNSKELKVVPESTDQNISNFVASTNGKKISDEMQKMIDSVQLCNNSQFRIDK